MNKHINIEHGVLTISLDFELYWGVRDKKDIEQYRKNLQGTRDAIRQVLRIFDANDIHATWATVGFLFYNNRDELKDNLPAQLPEYSARDLSPYRYIGDSVSLDREYHFAPDIIELIHNHEGQEIGTHTFSHYYCLENGQSLAQFRSDISAALDIAGRKGLSIRSLVFPRNQWSPDYLRVLDELGVQCYRGNESSWMYSASANRQQSILQRIGRLLDSYINLTGHHTYSLSDTLRNTPFNFPASRFLRPYSKKLAVLDGMRMKRITKAMDDAAINKKVFHLWWHPHNFGINTAENIDFLAAIIAHYHSLKKQHGMASLNMDELSSIGGPKFGR